MCQELVETGEKMRIGLVSCAKTKLSGIHAARDLYVSPLFPKAFTFAETTCDRVYILSAKHGLLGPEARVRDYDVTLNHASGREREDWSKRVLQQLESKITTGDELFFFCGKRYREHLIMKLNGKHRCVVPLCGLSLGQQLRWYKQKSA